MRAESAVDEHGKTQGDENKGACIEGGGHFCGGGLQVGSEDRGRIGNKGDEEEKAAIGEMKTRVGAMHIAKNGVVMHPHDEDSEETGDQREIAGPELQQGFA